jgi:hypothetical protein
MGSKVNFKEWIDLLVKTYSGQKISEKEILTFYKTNCIGEDYINNFKQLIKSIEDEFFKKGIVVIETNTTIPKEFLVFEGLLVIKSYLFY